MPPTDKTPIPAGFLRDPLHLLALGFGSGCAPSTPGTAGTLVGVVLYLPMQYLHFPYYVLAVSVLFLIGIPICGRTARDLGEHDHGAIVWDEIVGYLATMTLAPLNGWWWMGAGFVLFRVFDIWKPWPIQLLDRRVPGGLGIMADDLLAAIYSLISLQIIAHFPVGWLQS